MNIPSVSFQKTIVYCLVRVYLERVQNSKMKSIFLSQNSLQANLGIRVATLIICRRLFRTGTADVGFEPFLNFEWNIRTKL